MQFNIKLSENGLWIVSEYVDPYVRLSAEPKNWAYDEYQLADFLRDKRGVRDDELPF